MAQAADVVAHNKHIKTRFFALLTPARRTSTAFAMNAKSAPPPSNADDVENRKVADALKHSWVYYLPESIWPYAQLARWERPIGWWLLMWPCWWSLALAAAVEPAPARTGYASLLFYLALFTLGAVAMRGAGCTYNDLVDIDIDDKVARTRSRPLPSGRATRERALIFLALQLLAGLLILVQFNTFTVLTGLTSVVTILVYPFMKRITWWPQLFLGFAFSWGALMGWPALYSELNLPPLALYLGCICWVIGYDTIYAHQDREDDAIVGIGSTALLFGENTRAAVSALYAAALSLFAIAYGLAGAGWPAWVGLAAGGLHMIWQMMRLDIDDPDECLRLFKSNSHFGWILFAGLAGAVLISRM